jgi:hypothetical protein
VQSYAFFAEERASIHEYLSFVQKKPSLLGIITDILGHITERSCNFATQNRDSA